MSRNNQHLELRSDGRAASLFLSHGAPDLVLSDAPASRFLQELSASLTRPVGIVVISAHWQTSDPMITEAGPLETIYDFYGFPDELYDIRYPARATDDLVARVSSTFSASPSGFAPAAVRRGLDHGAWVPLLLLYPEADIPVVQLSLPRGAEPADLFALGRQLEPLRDEGIAIIASGGSVHNLRKVGPEGSTTPDWATAFDDWVAERLLQGEREALFDYQRQAPNASTAHPTPEHFVPLFVAYGAGGDGATVHRLHHSFTYGSVGMADYLFD